MPRLHLFVGIFAILVGLLRILAVTTFEPAAPEPSVGQPEPGPFDRLVMRR